MIKNCKTCGDKAHTQDELHGQGNRVFNEFRGKTQLIRRCTRCGAEETSALPQSKEKK